MGRTELASRSSALHPSGRQRRCKEQHISAKKAETKPARQPGKKSEETRARILHAALGVFRERGFERATMREIAEAAEVATGAAYYYFDSKDALVMAFYAEAQVTIRADLEAKLPKAKTLEARLQTIITEKFEYFAPNRELLRALSVHTDPDHPLSPFSDDSKPIRDLDQGFFETAVNDSGVKLGKDLQQYLPRLLWMYQMGLILFWVYDKSASQRKTMVLMEKSMKMLLLTIKLASIPLLRPMHKMTVELLRAVYDDE